MKKQKNHLLVLRLLNQMKQIEEQNDLNTLKITGLHEASLSPKPKCAKKNIFM